ncbi:hypothetical protein EV182_006924, partial [Spiromyces aspiralis]
MAAAAVKVAPHLLKYQVDEPTYLDSLLKGSTGAQGAAGDSALPCRIVIGAAISASGTDVLVVQRAANERSFPNQWELPGGHCDPGETILETVVREVKEETGLEVLSIDDEFVSFDYSTQFESGGAITRQLNFVVRVAESDRTNVRLAPDEHQAYAWCTQRNIDEFQMIGPMKDVVADALRVINGTTLTGELKRRVW